MVGSISVICFLKNHKMIYLQIKHLLQQECLCHHQQVHKEVANMEVHQVHRWHGVRDLAQGALGEEGRPHLRGGPESLHGTRSDEPGDAGAESLWGVKVLREQQHSE